jgi:hypothetical protein
MSLGAEGKIMSPKTRVHTPPMKSSDEATQEQLRMAKAQGKAYEEALVHMTQKEAEGEEKAAGDYLVAYAVEDAEGMYEFVDGELMWHEPDRENAHFEIAVRDGADGRFIPGLTIYLTVRDKDGKEIGTHLQPFMWHPWLYHYGRNWVLPGNGEYTLHVRIDPPTWHRHDDKNGKRYAKPVEVEFRNVQVKTGQKLVSE